MASNKHLESNGQFSNDVSYEELSAYIASLSHLNPSLVSANMSSPILNNSMNSGPSVGPSSFITEATSSISDNANFQRTSSFNIDSYQNFPSSPLSFSSSNMSTLAIEGGSSSLLNTSNLNQMNQAARGKGRKQNDMSSALFAGKERELLDYSSQMSKKPRLDPYVENALHQLFIQQSLQRQEPLAIQDYNLQLKTLLQQQNLQQLKQKQVLQSIPQYAPTEQQMMCYLQQMAKRSVPVFQPLRSGICSRRLMQFMYHMQHRPSDNNITYWRNFVEEYYAPRAKKRWCLSLYNGVGERALGVFSQLAMESWHCDICGSKPGKGFEANFELLPRLYKTYYEGGVLDELLFLDLPHEYLLPSGLILLRYEKAVQETIFKKFRVVREGQLRIIFRNDLKILAWEFCSRSHDEVVPRRLVAHQVNELVQAAEKCQGKSGSSGAVQNLQSTCKMFVATEGQLLRNLDSLLVNDLGFPKSYIRCLQVAEIANSMKDLMAFSSDNKMGPIESLAKYSQERTIGNTQKQQVGTSEAVMNGSKQAVYGGMSCHQVTQNSKSNSGKQKSSAFVNHSNQDAYRPPLVDPKPSSQSHIQLSPVSCNSSSTLTEFDDKFQEQMIDKILQQMESNTRETTNLNKNPKVKAEAVESLEGRPSADVATGNKGTGRTSIPVWKSVAKNGPPVRDGKRVNVKGEVVENPNEGPTADVATRNAGKGRIGSNIDFGNTNNAAWKAVPKNGPKIRDSSRSESSNITVKPEPDMEDIYKGLYLPEAIRDVDREFFRMGSLNESWNDIGWKGKN